MTKNKGEKKVYLEKLKRYEKALLSALKKNTNDERPPAVPK